MLALVPTPILAASADADKGTITWEKDWQYWPNEDEAKYRMAYDNVTIEGICPGASNEYRLTVVNLTDEALSFHLTVEGFASSSGFEALPAEWVTVTTEGSYQAGKVKPVTLISVAPAGLDEEDTSEKRVWVHISVPEDKGWLDRQLQCRIKIVEVADEDGPISVVSVSTANHMCGVGDKNAPVILGTLVFFALLIGGAVYIFSRWRWPDKPKDKKGKGDDKASVTPPSSITSEPQVMPAVSQIDGFSNGLSPADWQEQQRS